MEKPNINQVKLEKNQKITNISINDAENGVSVGLSIETRYPQPKKDNVNYDYKTFVFTSDEEATKFILDALKLKREYDK